MTDDGGPAFDRNRWCAMALQAPGRPLQQAAALQFAPVGALVPEALRALRPGGTVVCAGIHMSDIPSFPYAWLWGERRIVSVANLTRQDGEDFMRVAAEVPLQVSTHAYPLAQTNQAHHPLCHRSHHQPGRRVAAMRANDDLVTDRSGGAFELPTWVWRHGGRDARLRGPSRRMFNATCPRNRPC